MAVKKKDSARLAKRLGGNLSERRKQLGWRSRLGELVELPLEAPARHSQTPEYDPVVMLIRQNSTSM